jgi:hypothetical protein
MTARFRITVESSRGFKPLIGCDSAIAHLGLAQDPVSIEAMGIACERWTGCQRILPSLEAKEAVAVHESFGCWLVVHYHAPSDHFFVRRGMLSDKLRLSYTTILITIGAGLS